MGPRGKSNQAYERAQKLLQQKAQSTIEKFKNVLKIKQNWLKKANESNKGR